MQRSALAVVLLLLVISPPAFSQSTNATVSGTVQDASNAVLPRVEIAAKNNATGVVANVLSNESGAYSFTTLPPGVYTVSASLPGFQTRSYTDVQLGNAASLRLNFTLNVAGVDTTVEVAVAADTLLAASTQSIGEVLAQRRIAELQTIANDVM